jgi:uncharacterized NAD(P)/FAD-binding protein YdhS
LSADRRPSILVIGGGVSGAVFALHFLRDFPHQPARIEIVEPRERLGAGLAYTTDDPEHRMNGPADCMSALPDDELHFDAWFRRRGEIARDPEAELDDGRIIARRSVFGRYIEETLRETAWRSRNATLVHTCRRAVSAKRYGHDIRVILDDGSLRAPDILVLAVGHPPASIPPVLSSLPPSSRIVLDPWDNEALRRLPSDAPVLIIGTGLTAADVVASLAARGHRGKLFAVSRRGLFPLSRKVVRLEARGDFSDMPSCTARALFRRARIAATHHIAEGGLWEDVILALREQAPTIWGALPDAERRRFLRHVRSTWDLHRYPMAPQVSDVVDRLQRSGQLSVLAASITAVRVGECRYSVDLRHRGRRERITATLDVGAVVNCTGPAHGAIVDSSPLLRALAAEGLIQADPYGLGLLVEEDCRAIGRGRSANQPIFTIGPLTRGTFGEVIGFPQITTQPRQVASYIAALIAVQDKKADADAISCA